jgi:alkylation response protein AidB-like acyl-CoA dehydrogenase
MSNYRLTDEQRQLKEAARRFAEDKLRPIALETERKGAPMPREALKMMAEHGYVGLDIPPEYGGLGLDVMSCAVVLEELSSVWFSASTNAMTLLTGPLLAFGTEEQKQKYLPGIANGDILTAFALTESDAGSDASSIQTFARQEGDDWVINGSKIYITNGARADLIVLFARTDRDAPRGEGITLFLIEKGTPGFSVGQKYDMLAHTANPVAELVFNDCRVPSSCILGAPGGGFKYMQVGFSKARATYGARCASVAQAALNYALNYMQTREQFGQPLSSFQALRFRTAELYAKVAASMAKLFGSEVSTKVTEQCIQFLGGHGLNKDHPVERFYRETKLFQVGDGSSEMLSLLISRHLNKQAQGGMHARLASD